MDINIAKISTKALGGLGHDTIDASQNGKYTMVADHPLLLKLIEESNKYNAVMSKPTFSGQGEVVWAADKNRDDQYSNLKAYVGGVRRLSKMPNAKEADAIYTLLDTYDKGLTALSYVEESAQMRKIFEELAKPAIAEQIARMGLREVIEDLKKAQAGFESLYGQQAEANGELRTLPSATAVRKNLETALKAYFGLLESMKTVEGWEGLYADVAQHVQAAK